MSENRVRVDSSSRVNKVHLPFLWLQVTGEDWRIETSYIEK